MSATDRLSGPLQARTCACERPIIERKPGGWIGCAKCGRQVAREGDHPLTDGAFAGRADGGFDQGEAGAAREERIDWPLALAASDGDTRSEGE